MTTRSDAVAERRPAYLSDLAAGTERFFDERRESCPWCDSKQLGVLLRTTDVMQHKPGVFVLESCKDCGHVFQNPRLNDDGLEFYYRDFYDGLGEENMNKIFGTKRAGHDGRTHMVAAQVKPKQWLDVGTGHGHFLADAKRVLPDTEFDGLDRTDGVLIAQQKGRVRKAYQGSFVDLAPEFAAEYDVISMYHYLEHTADPKAEMAAAAAALPVGGHLAIELPDPECAWAKLLGKWWISWLQPQHLHMIPIANLRSELKSLGLTVVSEQRAEPHNGQDVVSAAVLAINAGLIGGEDLAWRPAPPTRARALVRKVAFNASVPVLALAYLVDRVSAAVGGGRGLSNTYRVLARKTS
ncbi:class I SAM-dependent methyltransferase [Streptomyces sp. NPDC020800]|uniref:class I SAM-dependent methyltransferase n=1 Tax=Streptomyces sp. NPDC020800 TaxID=3365092 RepID=UPI00378CFC3D